MICNLGVVGSNPTRGSKEKKEVSYGDFLLFLCLLGNAVATNENTEKQRVALFFCISSLKWVVLSAKGCKKDYSKLTHPLYSTKENG